MLMIARLQHSFGDRPVLADVSLLVPPRSVVGLLGPSGCGKTTTLHIAAGLLAARGGRVENGFRRTALVFQEPRLLPWRRAIDNIAFGLKVAGVARPARRATAAALGSRLGIEPQTQHLFPRQLSGGTRQRVAIARALAVEPDLLLMDEPFGALDIGLKRSLQDLVRRQIEERALAALVVTHDIADAVRLCDRIIMLSPAPARIVATIDVERPFAARDEAYLHETAAALLRRPEVADAFAPRAGV